MRIACIIDPYESLHEDHDTSLAILREAQARGHEVHICEIGDLSVSGGRLFLQSRELPDNGEKPGSAGQRESKEFNLIFMRKDPPVDRAFLQATYMLDCSDVPVWNSPRGLREASEKFFAQRFPDLIPPTLITQQRAYLEDFLDEMGGTMVVKPVDGYAGKGVFLVRKDDPNRGAILESATSEWRYPAMAQRYLPEIAQGDKRVLILDGEPIGALNRLPKADEFRANMAAGGDIEAGVVTERDRDLVEAIAPALKDFGLHFVGLDVIGGLITEVNVTSPTCLVEISDFDGVNLAAKVVETWEKRYG